MAERTYELKDQPEGGDLWRAWETGANIEFVDDDTERQYRKRATRVRRAIELKEPDRVPVSLPADFLAGHLADVSFEEMMYDADQAKLSYRKYVDAFEPDLNPIMPLPSGKMFDILGYDLYDYPGDGVQSDVAYQAREAEYMTADEYDELIANPEGYFLKQYMPRIFSELAGLEQLPIFASMVELPMTSPSMIPFGTPPVQDALDTLKTAGEEALRWQQEVESVVMETVAAGYPLGFGGFCKAPFDTIGDTLRGTRETMIDMRKRPETLKAAAEALVPLMVKLGVNAAKETGTPMVFFVLHKGADAFMSPEDYREFYWPTLKATVEGVMEHGIVPWLFAEGSYESRLEIVADDHPEGPVVWYFDQTDMALAKEYLGDKAALAGNVPTGLIKTGTPEAVRDYCENLIAEVGPEGFILAPGAAVYRADRENLGAIVDSVKA